MTLLSKHICNGEKPTTKA